MLFEEILAKVLNAMFAIILLAFILTLSIVTVYAVSLIVGETLQLVFKGEC